MKKKRLLAAVLCGCMLAGCAAQQTTEGEGSGSGAPVNRIVTQLSQDEFPAFGGCSALFLPGNLAAAVTMGSSYETAAESTGFYGSNEEAWERLLDEQLDIVLAYAPADSTKQRLEEQGVSMQQVGTDALVFLAGVSQDAQSLTHDQIQEAYSTSTGTWKGYAAAPGSTSRQLFARAFGADRSGVTVKRGDDVLTAACPHTAGTLCYTTYLSLQTVAPPENTIIVSVDGVAPSGQTLIDGSYPLSMPYYVGLRNGLEENDAAVLLYRWLTSKDGMAWLAQAVS